MEQDIYIEQIHLDRMPLRENVSTEDVAQLANDIQRRGLLQAIVVRARDGGGWSLVAGRRRLTAVKSLGWTTIPARIWDNQELDEIDGMAENVMRKQMSPLEEAVVVGHLHEKEHMSIAEICERTNHGTSWVQDRLALLQFPENFRRAVATKKIGISAAQLLLQIGQEDYRDYLLKVGEVNGCTVHQAESWLLDYQARSKMMSVTAAGGVIPQLPLAAPEPSGQCAFCDESHPFSSLLVIRVCIPCGQELQQTKRNAPPIKQ